MSHVVRWINSFAFWPRLALWSLILHGFWEFFQCLFFYDMSGFNLSKGALWMGGATLGDVVMTLLLVGAALWLRSQNSRFPFLPALILSGFLVAVGIESIALADEWWRYAASMPQLKFAGVTLGLFPVLQMALLPYFAAKIAHVTPFES